MTLSDSKNRQRSRSIARVLNDDASLINIKTFAIAARYMSFKAAARHLGLTSGAVSHRIARLEKEMKAASKMLEFEYAALLRDQIIELRGGK